MVWPIMRSGNFTVVHLMDEANRSQCGGLGSYRACGNLGFGTLALVALKECERRIGAATATNPELSATLTLSRLWKGCSSLGRNSPIGKPHRQRVKPAYANKCIGAVRAAALRN